MNRSTVKKLVELMGLWSTLQSLKKLGFTENVGPANNLRVQSFVFDLVQIMQVQERQALGYESSFPVHRRSAHFQSHIASFLLNL